MRFRDTSPKSDGTAERKAKVIDNQSANVSAAASANCEPMKLIPWEDIWTSLRIATIRGNGDMIEVFYDTLFREAIFDDYGAWSLNRKNRY
jgi:hypothetical protein